MKTNLTNGDIFNKWAIINIIDELYLRGFDFKTMSWIAPFRFPLMWQDSNKFIQINRKYEHSPRWEPLKEYWDGYIDAAEVRRRLMGTFDKNNILKIRKRNDLKHLTISSVNEELILEYEFQIDKKITQQNSWKRIQGFGKNNIDMILAMANVIKMKLELLSKQERDNGVIFLKIPIAQEFVKLDYLEQIQILKALYRWGIIAELKINNRQAEIFIPQRAMLYEFIDFVKSPQNMPLKEKPHYWKSSPEQLINKRGEMQEKQPPTEDIFTGNGVIEGDKDKRIAKQKTINKITFCKTGNDLKVILNDDYQSYVDINLIGNNYWGLFFKLVVGEQLEFKKGLYDYFNSNKKNKLYSNTHFPLQKVLKRKNNCLELNVKTEIISALAFKKRLQKA